MNLYEKLHILYSIEQYNNISFDTALKTYYSQYHIIANYEILIFEKSSDRNNI